MSKEKRIILNRIKSVGVISYESDISHERTLKKMAAVKKANDLFFLGSKWFRDGKSLDDVLNNPKSLNLNDKKEITSFVRGYQSGINDYGRELGYRGVRIEDLPSEYVTDRYFLDGYRNGLIEYQKVEEKRNKSR